MLRHLHFESCRSHSYKDLKESTVNFDSFTNIVFVMKSITVHYVFVAKTSRLFPFFTLHLFYFLISIILSPLKYLHPVLLLPHVLLLHKSIPWHTCTQVLEFHNKSTWQNLRVLGKMSWTSFPKLRRPVTPRTKTQSLTQYPCTSEHHSAGMKVILTELDATGMPSTQCLSSLEIKLISLPCLCLLCSCMFRNV